MYNLFLILKWNKFIILLKMSLFTFWRLILIAYNLLKDHFSFQHVGQSHSIRRNKDVNNRARWLRDNARDSHSGGPRFESRCRTTSLRFFVVFLNHQGKCWVGFLLPRSIWPLFIKFIYHKIKISKFNKRNIDYTTTEIHSLLVYTQRS